MNSVVVDEQSWLMLGIVVSEVGDYSLRDSVVALVLAG